MGGICNTHGRKKMHTNFQPGNLTERDQLQGTGVKNCIQIDLKDMGFEGTEWVHMAWGRNWNTVTEFQVLQKAGNLTSEAADSFSWTSFHDVSKLARKIQTYGTQTFRVLHTSANSECFQQRNTQF